MRTLAIETATEACSVALFEGDALLAHRHELLGRGHAEHLVPFIAGLPDRGKADRILVSLGPGSFTGVRIGVAAARALALAWGAEVLGYPTLALIAAMSERDKVLVCMNGGHGEWFVQPFTRGAAEVPCRSLAPAEAIDCFEQEFVAGSRAEEFIAARDYGEALELLPDARHALALNPGALSHDIAPIYGRGPDARLPQ